MMLEDVINTALDARLINLHTAIPCEVVSVDYSTQTVSVKIVVHRITADDTVLPYEVINEVPIGYTQTKNIISHFLLKQEIPDNLSSMRDSLISG